MLEAFTGLPYATVLLAVFLASMLPPLLLSALAGWWDNRGRAMEAILWPLRSPIFWLPCLLWLTGGMTLLLFADSQEVELVVIAVSAIALATVPFLCMNPSTLDASSTSHWWRPGWPGWRALRWCLVIWVVCAATSFVLEKLGDITSVAWLTILLSMLDELISSFALVMIVAIWLNRGRMQRAWADLVRIARNGFIGEFVWQSLLIALILVISAVPFFVAMIELVFVLPQYQQWVETTGKQLPFWLSLLSEARPEGLALLMVAAVPFGLYLGFAQGRLMRQHGVGLAIQTD